jgi:dUTP pyrophosphatase
MDIKFKRKFELVPIPFYATEGAACMDLTAISEPVFNETGNYWEYDTGLAFEIPKGYVGLLFPRSSNTKMDLILGNSVGVIDSDYRGWVSLRYKEISKLPPIYQFGDRIGQIMFIALPQVRLTLVAELESTERGSGSYGSTGK